MQKDLIEGDFFPNCQVLNYNALENLKDFNSSIPNLVFEIKRFHKFFFLKDFVYKQQFIENKFELIVTQSKWNFGSKRTATEEFLIWATTAVPNPKRHLRKKIRTRISNELMLTSQVSGKLYLELTSLKVIWFCDALLEIV